MTASHALHRSLVLALAAWMSLCCCEKRILAHAIDDAGSAPRACCADDCCSDGGGSDDGEQDHPRNCSDGCCVKSCAAAPAFVPAIDAIGAVMPLLCAPIRDDLGCGRVLSHDDRTAGEPPPRLALVISRRLRI